jgi:hypothetical protein
VFDADVNALLDGVTGVFITGGDQMRLVSLLGGTQFAARLRKMVTETDIVLAGTSAGAAGMSTSMIVRGESTSHPHKNSVRLSPGLGFLKTSSSTNTLPNAAALAGSSRLFHTTRIISALGSMKTPLLFWINRGIWRSSGVDRLQSLMDRRSRITRSLRLTISSHSASSAYSFTFFRTACLRLFAEAADPAAKRVSDS